MEKKLYWLVEDNGDLSVTVSSLTDAQMTIECDFDSLNDDEKPDVQYTVTPSYLTDEEYENLPEA